MEDSGITAAFRFDRSLDPGGARQSDRAIQGVFVSKKMAHGNRGSGARQQSRSGNRAQKPDWAAGLRQLYDSVVEEPLPDSFKDLLSKLDDDRK